MSKVLILQGLVEFQVSQFFLASIGAFFFKKILYYVLSHENDYKPAGWDAVKIFY